MLHSQSSSPRVAEEMNAFEPERTPNRAEFVHEVVQRPKALISRRVGVPATELIVKNDITLGGHRRDGLEMIVRYTRATMNDEKWRRCRPPRTYSSIPYTTAGYAYETLLARETTAVI